MFDIELDDGSTLLKLPYNRNSKWIMVFYRLLLQPYCLFIEHRTIMCIIMMVRRSIRGKKGELGNCMPVYVHTVT